MLSQANNELLTRVGPGTPTGDLLRRFWFPALLEEEAADWWSGAAKQKILRANADKIFSLGLLEKQQAAE